MPLVYASKRGRVRASRVPCIWNKTNDIFSPLTMHTAEASPLPLQSSSGEVADVQGLGGPPAQGLGGSKLGAASARGGGGSVGEHWRHGGLAFTTVLLLLLLLLLLLIMAAATGAGGGGGGCNPWRPGGGGGGATVLLLLPLGVFAAAPVFRLFLSVAHCFCCARSQSCSALALRPPVMPWASIACSAISNATPTMSKGPVTRNCLPRPRPASLTVAVHRVRAKMSHLSALVGVP